MDSHLIFDLNGPTFHVNELAGQDIENEIEETSGLELPAASKNHMIDRLLARQKLWSSSGRALVLQGVYSDDGRAATGEEAAHLLADHWSSVFEAREACQESYELLRGFVQKADNIGNWQCSLLDVEQLLSRLRKSAPGLMASGLWHTT